MSFRVTNLGVIWGQLQKGVSGARSDDTKSLKAPIVDWITPRDGHLNPPIGRNIKSERGYNHPRTGALLCPAGLCWEDLERVTIPADSSLTDMCAFRTRSKLQSGDMIVPGDQWPIFLYEEYTYDPEEPWKGLFRSQLLVQVRLARLPLTGSHFRDST